MRKLLLAATMLTAGLFGMPALADASSTISYQGQLRSGGSPLTGTADFICTLYDDESAGNVVGTPVQLIGVNVEDGLFNLELDFGSAAFNGSARWVEIAVANPSGGSFTTLTPRQAVTAAPRAIYSENTRGLTINPAGNVGIGTTSTITPLTVVGPDDANGTAWFSSAKGPNNSHVHYGPTGDWYLRSADNAGKVVLQDSGGYVGIRTSNPQTTLDVNGDATIRGFHFNFIGADFYMGWPSRGDGGRAIVHEGDGTSERLVFNFANDFNDGVRIEGKMFLPGKVGITAQAGDFPLGFGTGLGDKISLWGDSGSHYGFGVQNGLLQIHSHSAGDDVAFGYGSSNAFTETMRVKGNGRVGIGTNNPSAKLHIVGTPGTDGIMFPDGTLQTTASSGGWGLSGNANVGGGFIGTNDQAPLVLKVNSRTVAQYQYRDNVLGATANVITGASVNFLDSGVEGATIAGGGADAQSGNDYPNAVLFDFGTVSGGLSNWARAYATTVSGGYNNTAGSFLVGVGQFASVGGGTANNAYGSYSRIGGGNTNTAGSDYGTVAGGNNNYAQSYGSTVAGGLSNRAGNNGSSDAAFVGGGNQNIANSRYSVVAGGNLNNAVGLQATIGGGDHNLAIGDNSTIAGGINNTAHSHGATVCGGINNVAGQNTVGAGSGAIAAGGTMNTAQSQNSAVLGGTLNVAVGNNSAVIAGNQSQTNGSNSVAMGSFARANNQGAFVWSDASSVDPFGTTFNNQFIVRATGGVGINLNNPTSALHVNGTITGSVKNFLIDHPLDPENKTLRHASIESSELINLYSGSVKTDADGRAIVVLPAWMEALNTDFRYQLTVAGDDDDSFVQAKIAREIEDSQFVIRTSKPDVKVFWAITGVRKDAFAAAHPLIVEQDKPEWQQGYFLSAMEHGQPVERDINRAVKPETDTLPDSAEVSE